MRSAVFWSALLVLLSASLCAVAEPSRATDLGSSFSDFERDVARAALAHTGFELEPNAAGKRIEGVEVLTLDVFDERDPVPDFVNVFHVTSRKYVIARELLFKPGDRWNPLRVEESARNLRMLNQLSLVLILPARGSRPDSVRVLVITKDVWSLRLNWDAQVANGKLQTLVLNPSERNLLGTHTNIGALLRLRPDTYALGARFDNPRLFGSRVELALSANGIWNRASGAREGSYGYAVLQQPLYSRESRWGFRTALAWLKETTRSYVGLTERVYVANPTSVGRAPCAGNAYCNGRPRPGEPLRLGYRIPYEYLTDRWVAEANVVRSFGHLYKYDFSAGAELDRRGYALPELNAYDPRAVAAFVRDELPVSDTRISPVLQIHAYSSRLLHVVDFETLGLQEDYAVGHEVVWRVYPASRDFGSSRDMIGTYAALSYTLPVRDGLLRGVAASTIDFADHERHDALLEVAVRAVTPRLGFGRVVFDGELFDRYRNYLNRKFVIGGDTRLRGYPVGAFIGRNVLASSLEFRSRSVEILSAHVGAAAFYDVGDAFDDFSRLELKQGAGLGLRILFPQLDRTVFRADWGFPLSPGYRTWPGTLFVTFGQAFGLPALASPSPTAAFIAAPQY